MKYSIFLLSVFFVLFGFACRQKPIEAVVPPTTVSKEERVDTLLLPRPFLGDTARALVLLPKGYTAYPDSSFPVVYLLHGYSGDYNSWLKQAPQLPYWASRFGQIIVMPDGAYNSWYLDSPIKTEQTFAQHLGVDLPTLVDSLYRTLPEASGRAITGLSMGGHGAMHLAAEFPQQFGAVGSMSGGLDLRPFPDNWDLQDILGDPVASAKNWEQYSVINQLEAFQGRSTPILIDCGVDDFFFEVNQSTHERLLDLEVPHDYIVRPGAHTWEYWRKVLPHHLLFFDQFFNP